MCLRFPKFLTCPLGEWASSPVRRGKSNFVAGKSLAIFVTLALAQVAFARDLHVCADPDNLPFSNIKQQGFENRIAEVLARDLHAQLQYQWQRMGRGFVRDYLNAGRCDVLIGVPSNFSPVLTTDPYYRSGYVFVTRRDYGLQFASLNDPSLHGVKIGVQALDEDYTPPATALARRGLQNQIVPFEATSDQAGSIVRAVADRRVDTAIVWGPLAGFYAQKFNRELQLTPVAPEIDPPNLPFTFSISMGVRKGNTALRDELDGFLKRHQSDIRKILDHYGVPELELPTLAQGGP